MTQGAWSSTLTYGLRNLSACVTKRSRNWRLSSSLSVHRATAFRLSQKESSWMLFISLERKYTGFSLGSLNTISSVRFIPCARWTIRRTSPSCSRARRCPTACGGCSIRTCCCASPPTSASGLPPPMPSSTERRSSRAERETSNRSFKSSFTDGAGALQSPGTALSGASLWARVQHCTRCIGQALSLDQAVDRIDHQILAAPHE